MDGAAGLLRGRWKLLESCSVICVRFSSGSGSPTEKAGVAVGDLLLEIEGLAVPGAKGEQLKKVRAVLEKASVPGDQLHLRLRRPSGETYSVVLLAAPQGLYQKSRTLPRRPLIIADPSVCWACQFLRRVSAIHGDCKGGHAGRA